MCGHRWRSPPDPPGPAGEAGSLWARARRAVSTCPSRQSTSPRAAAGARAPPGAARELGSSLGGRQVRYVERASRARPESLGQAWGRPGCARVLGETRAGRETSFKSYLHDRAHRGASKQLALGAHPKYPDSGSPVLCALDLRRFGFSAGGHHGHWRVWGNHLLEGLDDVRSRCDFFFF